MPPARAPGVAADITDEDEGPRQVRRGPGGAVRPVAAPKTTAKPAPQKQRGRLTLVTALNADDVRERSIASFRRRTQRLKGHQSNEPKEKLVREVIIPEAINIQELANRMAERAVDVIRLLMKQGAMHKITDVIDADTAQLLAEERGARNRAALPQLTRVQILEWADSHFAQKGRWPTTTSGPIGEGDLTNGSHQSRPVAQRQSARLITGRWRFDSSRADCWRSSGPKC